MAGLPGTGKSTVAQELGNRLGFPVVSVDQIESSILSAGIDSDQPTGLAAYLVAETLAGNVLESGRSVIVDAVNAVLPAREQWVGLAARHGNTLSFVEVICSDSAVHRERLEARSRDLPYINEPTWNAVEQRVDEYSEWEGVSAAADRITLDSIEPLATIVDKALVFIES